MNIYPLLKNILFKLPPETAHRTVLNLLERWPNSFVKKTPSTPLHVMGLVFDNPVGLAGGFDRHAEHIDGLAKLGFGFIEVGTLTPKPQAGNPKPRLFRLKKEEALINRMGFYNKGVEHALPYLAKRSYKGILGVSIGKNSATPNEKAIDDYYFGLKKVYPYADYIALNLSSPNTPNLRALQNDEHLLSALKQEQHQHASRTGRYVPLVVKIDPDLNEKQIKKLSENLINLQIDGVIATNTTIARIGVEKSEYAKEAGGLSGKPLTHKSTEIIQILSKYTQGNLPIIGVGGIFTPQDAIEKIAAGASLIQLYTGFIYRGPKLIKDTIQALRS